MPPDDPTAIASLNSEAATLDSTFRKTSTSVKTSLSAIGQDVRATRAEIARTTEAGKALSTALSSGLDKAFSSALKDGAKLSDVLRTLALDLSRSVASTAIGGLTDRIGGTFGGLLGQGLGSLLGFSRGAAFDAGKVRAFARGGIVGGPTLFPMQGATGLMGEAGPEAILPLQRTPDGRLGVAAGGAGQGGVSVTIVTQDADSFARSRTQVAATLARAVDRGRRNL